ncbi:MAG: histidine kinase [Chloroflexi bacterium HGW-Chloroflexi-4]|jgi:signal transduction histidine kinase|nr:MAG: histidine kinase [Chloroflexi bacterium HGW-Chloroflexi-4]
MQPILEVNHLTKHIGPLLVLKNMSFSVYPGEVLGLAGWGGAGKSVLASILAGIQTPEEGELYFDGKRIKWPFNSRKFGFEVIHQEPRIVEGLDICSNIFLGNELAFPQWQNDKVISPQKKMDLISSEILAKLDVSLPSLHDDITTLSIEYRQLVAIARAMIKPSRLILVDDTSALLGYHYQQILLALIQNWQQEGKSIIFSSNNLDHLFSVTDRIAVLREGSMIGAYKTDEVNREILVADLVGTTDQQQITPIIWALDSYYRARERAEVLRNNQILLERDLAARDSLNKQLLEQLNVQVLALDKANTALQDAHRRLLSNREDERKSLARELHDQTIQDLLRLNYQLERIEENEIEASPIKERISNIRFDVKILIEELRRVCSNLRPPTIDSLGLGSAITSLVDGWRERTGIPISLTLDENLIRLPEDTELSIFRIIQESLHNIVKHSQAKNVEISLRHTTPRTILISICDDGVGLPEDFNLSTLASNDHYGLLGISERVALLGGHLNIQNQKIGGAIIQVEIPHPRSKKKIENTE